MPSNTEQPPAALRERLKELAIQEVNTEDSDTQAKLQQQRCALLEEIEWESRIRNDSGEPVLVCYPQQWTVDGTIDPDAINSIDRAVEIPLRQSPDSWEAIAEHNETVAILVNEEYGEIHGENAAAFATFMNNHRAKPIEDASDETIEEFVREYYPRNAWPSKEAVPLVRESIEATLEIAKTLRG